MEDNEPVFCSEIQLHMSKFDHGFGFSNDKGDQIYIHLNKMCKSIFVSIGTHIDENFRWTKSDMIVFHGNEWIDFICFLLKLSQGKYQNLNPLILNVKDDGFEIEMNGLTFPVIGKYVEYFQEYLKYCIRSFLDVLLERF